MAMLDDLLDDYEAVAEAATRLMGSRIHSEGNEWCCDNGRCLSCDEAYIRAEEHLHRALAKVAPRPFRPGACHALDSGSGPHTQRETKNLRSGPAEYLRRFFPNWRNSRVGKAVTFPMQSAFLTSDCACL